MFLAHPLDVQISVNDRHLVFDRAVQNLAARSYDHRTTSIEAIRDRHQLFSWAAQFLEGDESLALFVPEHQTYAFQAL